MKNFSKQAALIDSINSKGDYGIQQASISSLRNQQSSQFRIHS